MHGGPHQHRRPPPICRRSRSSSSPAARCSIGCCRCRAPVATAPRNSPSRRARLDRGRGRPRLSALHPVHEPAGVRAPALVLPVGLERRMGRRRQGAGGAISSERGETRVRAATLGRLDDVAFPRRRLRQPGRAAGHAAARAPATSRSARAFLNGSAVHAVDRTLVDRAVRRAIATASRRQCSAIRSICTGRNDCHSRRLARRRDATTSARVSLEPHFSDRRQRLYDVVDEAAPRADTATCRLHRGARRPQDHRIVDPKTIVQRERRQGRGTFQERGKNR